MAESSTIIAASVHIPDENSIVRIWSSVGYLSDSLNGMSLKVEVKNRGGGSIAAVDIDMPLLTLRSIADAIYNAIDLHEERCNQFDAEYRRQVAELTKLIPSAIKSN